MLSLLLSSCTMPASAMRRDEEHGNSRAPVAYHTDLFHAQIVAPGDFLHDERGRLAHHGGFSEGKKIRAESQECDPQTSSLIQFRSPRETNNRLVKSMHAVRTFFKRNIRGQMSERRKKDGIYACPPLQGNKTLIADSS